MDSQPLAGKASVPLPVAGAIQARRREWGAHMNGEGSWEPTQSMELGTDAEGPGKAKAEAPRWCYVVEVSGDSHLDFYKEPTTLQRQDFKEDCVGAYQGGQILF